MIPEDWFAGQVEQADHTEGDIDTLSNRIAHIRTWTFVSNRREWLKDPDHWQAKTREIEDKLSDALHEQLTQRFVDKRTSVLMKSMRDKDSLFAEIEKDGRVVVEKHYVGKLEGFSFTPDAAAAGVHGKAARNAAAKVLVHELAARADRLAAAPDTAFTLTREGQIIWERQEIGRISAGDDPLNPNFSLFSDEHLAAIDKDNITTRIETWLGHHIEVRLKPLQEISKAEEISGLAKGIAFRLRESFGVLKRETVADEIKSVDQEGRAQLRKYGVRFGAHHIYFPLLLKPASADLLLLLWLLKHGAEHNLTTAAIAEAPRQGLTSVPRNAAMPEAFYRAAGFHVCGLRAVRVDMLERLADIIRPLTAWKPTEAATEPPAGAAGGGAFRIRPEMMSIMGCSGDELGLILESLGFRREKRPLKKAAPVAGAAAVDGARLSRSGAAEAAPASAEAPDGVQAANDNAALPAGELASGAAEAEGSVVLPAEEPAPAAIEANDNVAPGSGEAHAEAASAEADGAGGESAAAGPTDSAAAAAPHADGEATAQAEAAPGESADPEFEEVWRFRRPKPKFERSEGAAGGRPHHRRPHGAGESRERGARPNQDRPRPPRDGANAAPPQGQAQDGQKDQAAGPGRPARAAAWRRRPWPRQPRSWTASAAQCRAPGPAAPAARCAARSWRSGQGGRRPAASGRRRAAAARRPAASAR